MGIKTGLPDTGAQYDLCVVGAGPIGLSVAMEAAEQGLSVLVLESGGMTPLGSAAIPTYGDVIDEKRHSPLDVAICRALGGTSWFWGGRCLPMDALDYDRRAHVPNSGWPIGPDALEPYYAKAAHYLDCGNDNFVSRSQDWTQLGDGVRVGALERWSRTREIANVHAGHLTSSSRITICLDVTVDGLETTAGRVTALSASSAGASKLISARNIVLAGGGLGTAKLLLEHQRHHPAAFGGPDGALGKYYMGHTFGKIADIVLANPEAAQSMDFYLDDTGTWVRRRIDIAPEAQAEDSILNTAFRVDNPAFHDHRHKSGILSAVYLALSVPPIGRKLLSEAIRRAHVGTGGNYGRHIANVALHPLSTAISAWQILRQRYLEKPRRTGFLIRNKSGRYALSYHGEQLPMAESRATLGSDGRLKVDLRFCEADAVSIVKAHDRVDRALRASGLGYLDYHIAPEQRVAAVLEQAMDGFHQEGLMRMGTDPANSVVDADCRVHDFDNLFIASTGVFPTSGQANPTFTGCALGLRLAHHLAGLSRKAAGAEEPSYAAQ